MRIFSDVYNVANVGKTASSVAGLSCSRKQSFSFQSGCLGVKETSGAQIFDVLLLLFA